MTLDEIVQTFLGSEADDWGEHIGFPTFLYGPPDAEQLGHDSRKVYQPDIAIGLAWGSEDNDKYVWEWVKQFADASARSVWIDLLYNGQVVYREISVNVDGGRATLPSPLATMDDKTREVTGWYCKRDEYEFVRAFARVTRDLREFDTYFERSGITIKD
jgi:hypothetical protein